jgi:NADH dehydrogenase
MSDRHHVVIVGGGFGGLRAARGLRRANVDITLIDRRNHYLFQPLLYQVATGGLSPANIATPLRTILRRQENVQVLLGEVVDIDVPGQRLVMDGGEALTYDLLIVATGVRHQYFGHPEWEPQAPGLKTIEDATEMRRRILTAFEEAERTLDPEERQAWMTFTIAGGGATGVELAGSIAELAHKTMRREFRSIEPAEARILLVEGGDRLLPSFPPKLSDKTAQALRQLGVTVQTNTLVTDVRPEGVTIKTGDHTEKIACRTVLWAAGVQASPLGPLLAKATGAALDRSGKIHVRPDLTLPDHPEIFVIGDLAYLVNAKGQPLPGVAQVAMQMGDATARLILMRLTGGQPPPPFAYKDLGSMAVIGRARAVVDMGWLWLWGYPAWLAWLFVHLVNIIDFDNRLLVMLQLAANYFTRNRSARLITGREPGARSTVSEKGPGAAASADGAASRPPAAT